MRTPAPIDLAATRVRIDRALEAVLADRARHLVSLGADLQPVADALVGFCEGGKRIRPLFAYCGWRAAGGEVADEEAVFGAIACLELVQAAALVHDDIIDESDSRRGKPSVHKLFERAHRAAAMDGDAERHGTAAAILIGDLALIWADAVLQSAGLPAEALLRVRRELDDMRIEVMSGQFLDVLEQARPAPPERAVESALRVAELKSASYTVARPLLIGAAIAGADESIRSAYARFGHHVGIAFQLRDDLLGVYGDPAVTGKPAGDDLREGKRTVLIARAVDRLGDRADEITDALGDPRLGDDEIDRIRTLLDSCGAVRDVEQLIDEHTAAARSALAGVELDETGRRALDELVDAATARAS